MRLLIFSFSVKSVPLDDVPFSSGQSWAVHCFTFKKDGDCLRFFYSSSHIPMLLFHTHTHTHTHTHKTRISGASQQSRSGNNMTCSHLSQRCVCVCEGRCTRTHARGHTHTHTHLSTFCVIRKSRRCEPLSTKSAPSPPNFASFIWNCSREIMISRLKWCAPCVHCIPP